MADERPEKEAEEGQEEEGGRKAGLLVPLLVALFALGVGGAMGTLFLGPGLAPMLVSDPSHEGEKGGGGHGGGGHGESASNIIEVENLVVNPAGTDGMRFLLVSVALELEDPSLVEEIAPRDVAIRDALILFFGRKTVDELAAVEGRKEMMAELKGTLEEVLGHGVIHRIYLPQYVIQ